MSDNNETVESMVIATIPDTIPDKIAYLPKFEDEFAIGKYCIICEKSFMLHSINDTRQICPTCLKKLRKIVGEMPDE